MPFINLKTTESLDQEAKDRLACEFCLIAQDCLGKGEAWVMCGFEPEASLRFRGSADSICYVEVKAFGSLSANGTNAMTGRLTSLLAGEFGISPDRIYVSYFDTPNWGWNGGNF